MNKKIFKNIIMRIIILTTILMLSPCMTFSRANIDSLYQVYDQLSIAEKKSAYLEFTAYVIRRDMDSSFYMLDSANRWIQDDEPELKSRLYAIYGTYYWYSGHLDTAIYYYHKGLRFAKISGADRYVLNNLTNLGAVMNQMGMVDSASYYLTKALIYSEIVDDEALTAKVHFDLGNLYSRKGFSHISLEHLQKSVAYYESIADSMLLVYNYNALATTYQGIDDFEKSQLYFTKAIEIDEIREDVDILANLYNNLGVTYWKLERNYDTARYFIQKALEHIPSFDNAVMYELVFKLNLGGIEVDDRNYEKALKLLLELDKLQLPYQDNYKVSALLINLGMAYRYNNRLDSARYYVNKGLKLAESVEAYENMKNAYAGLYQMDSIQGAFQSALANFKMQKQVQDSMASENVRNRIAELEIIHETEKKDSENRGLKKQNELQQNIISKQNTINIIIIIAAVFLLVFIYLLLQNRQKLNAANEELEMINLDVLEKNEIINAKNKDLEIQKEELQE